MTLSEIIIKEISLEEAVEISSKIPEFPKYNKEWFQNRIGNEEPFIIAAYINNEAVGYLLGFDKYHDDSFYIDMGGVDPEHRTKGAFKKMFDYQLNWTENKNYKALRATTRNKRRNMRLFLDKNGFQLIDIRKERKGEQLTIDEYRLDYIKFLE